MDYVCSYEIGNVEYKRLPGISPFFLLKSKKNHSFLFMFQNYYLYLQILNRLT
ncbi:unknown [Prevotella sp. CAG:1320]|nr:unknown [Prevotella sp. CAG:1320]